MPIISTPPKIEETQKPSKKRKIEDIPFLLVEKGNYKYVYLRKSDFELSYNNDFFVYKNKDF